MKELIIYEILVIVEFLLIFSFFHHLLEQQFFIV